MGENPPRGDLDPRESWKQNTYQYVKDKDIFCILL